MVTKTEPVYVPEYLLTGCPKTEWSGGSYRALAALAKSRSADIDNCNAQLKAIRKFQADEKAEAASAGAGR